VLVEILAFVGGIGLVWIGARVVRSYVARQPTLSEADDQIRTALAEGVLTDAELVEMGLDPAIFRAAPSTAIDTIVRDLEVAPQGKNRRRVEATLVRLQRAVEMTDVNIAAGNTRIQAKGLRMVGKGSISIQTNGVSIEIGETGQD